MKLIKLSEEHYVIVDESEIKEGDYTLTPSKKIILMNPENMVHYLDSLSDSTKKITHSTEPLEGNCTKNVCWDCHGKITDKGVCFCNNEVKGISLSEVEEAIYGYSVEKMAIDKFPYTDEGSLADCIDASKRRIWKDGFNAHKELVKDKLFTEVDMANLWMHVVNGAKEIMLSGESTIGTFQEYIDKLSPKTEWEVEFDEQGKLKLI